MKFRKAIDADIEIFMNLEEFGETHNVNGLLIPCILQKYTAEKSGNSSQNFEGLHGDFMTLHFRTILIDPLPHEGESIRIDENRYTVDNVEDMIGVTRLILSSYRGRRL